MEDFVHRPIAVCGRELAPVEPVVQTSLPTLMALNLRFVAVLQHL